MIQQFISNNFGVESNNPLNALVDTILRDVDYLVPRDRVQQLVAEEARPFEDAVAAKFVPNLVHRRVRIRLIQETQ